MKAFIYSNLILSQDTITTRFFPRIESFLLLLGTLELVLSDIFSFASFHLGCLQPLSYLLKCLSCFLNHGEEGAFPLPFSSMTASVGGTDPVSAKINSSVVHSDLLKSGFVPNEDKSQWEPIQIITWLGVILNTIDGSIKATDERIAKLCHDLETLSTLQHPTRV